MNTASQFALLILVFVVGNLFGAYALIKCMGWVISEHRGARQYMTQKLLSFMHRNGCQHWHTDSQEHDVLMCPCCGWSTDNDEAVLINQNHEPRHVVTSHEEH